VARTKVLDPAAFERAIGEVVTLVRREGSVPRGKMSKLGVPRASLEHALAVVEAAGLEVTKSKIRVPLREQLSARLADDAMLPMRSLKTAVSGGTPAEAKAAALDLARSGKALLVARGRELSLGPLRDDALGTIELPVLERALAELAKTVKLARKGGASLLREDVRDAIAPFASMAPRITRLGASDVLAAARRHEQAGGLVFVPTLVRALGGASAREAVHEALRDAARRGLLELQPESGLGRLSEDDLALCIPGPQGSHLSWARPIEDPP
jgi:hypothetical protein